MNDYKEIQPAVNTYLRLVLKATKSVMVRFFKKWIRLTNI